MVKWNSGTVFRYFCIGLLALHGLWACIHMYYHAQGYLNPWKLGGYAMYTRPAPDYIIQGSVLNGNGETDSTFTSIDVWEFGNYTTGGCLGGVDQKFYEWFLPRIDSLGFPTGKPLRFDIREENKNLMTQKTEKRPLGSITIEPTPFGLYTITQDFCGYKKEFTHVN